MKNNYKQNIINDLIENKIIKYGDFTLKSGQKSNYYVDMKSLVSFPNLSNRILNFINLDPKLNLSGDLICGVPYGGIYFSTILSSLTNIPMILLRNEIKKYGTQKQIEGFYNKGQKVIIFEDVITSGISLIEAIDTLYQNNLIVSDVIVLLDREKNGVENVKNHVKSKYNLDINIYSFLTITELLDNNLNISYFTDNNICVFTENLNRIIKQKQSNICLSLDETNWKKFFDVLDKVKDKICLLKIHLDLMDDIDQDIVNKLIIYSVKYNFMIWEDRKLCDIGNTNKLIVKKILSHKFSYFKGGLNTLFLNEHVDLLLRLENKPLVDFISVNPTGGIESLKPLFGEIGIFVLAEMSCNGNIINTQNCMEILQLSNNNNKYISGIINQTIDKEVIHPNLLSLTPGVNLTNKKDNSGQKYRDPLDLQNKPDILVVGRYIYKADDPRKNILELLENFIGSNVIKC
jgi:uridine monophosphate synthetase